MLNLALSILTIDYDTFLGLSEGNKCFLLSLSPYTSCDYTVPYYYIMLST